MFVCPNCRDALSDEPQRLHCGLCDRAFAKVDGIPIFAEKSEDHWGWLPESAVVRVLAERTGKGWDCAVRDLVAESPGLLRHILRRTAAEVRAAGKFLLSLPPGARVLDLGCGLGAFAFSFARSCSEVVAMDLMPNHLRWIRGYAQELGMRNLITACGGDSPRLPFADGTFDAVVMSGVWEYVALSSAGEPASVQLAFLRDIARVLKPDGQVYIGIENRLSWRYFRGRREEHTRLRFIALLPRGLANRVHRHFRRSDLRIYTHTIPGYRRMLAAAGFAHTQIFYPLPEYSRVRTLLPLDASSRRSLLPAATFRPRSLTDRLIGSNLARYFARSFVLIGQRAPRPSLLEELVAAARGACREARLRETRWNLDRYEVRVRSDKLHLHLSAGDGTRLLAKVPLTPSALENVRNSGEILDFLHAAPGLGAETKALIPRSLGQASAGMHTVFLEEWQGGTPVRRGVSERARLLDQSLGYLMRLHRESEERRRIDETLYAEHFGRRFEALRAWFSSAELEEVNRPLRRLEEYCRREVSGAELPLVVRHGDFSSTNRLFDPRSTRLTAIVDWDGAERRGLPLLDAIRLFLDAEEGPLAPSSPVLERSLRGVPDTLLGAAHRARYDDYLRALGIEPQLFAPLALMYWAQLLRQHLPVRRCRWDPLWRRENVLGGLQRWEERLRL